MLKQILLTSIFIFIVLVSYGYSQDLYGFSEKQIEAKDNLTFIFQAQIA